MQLSARGYLLIKDAKELNGIAYSEISSSFSNYKEFLLINIKLYSI